MSERVSVWCGSPVDEDENKDSVTNCRYVCPVVMMIPDLPAVVV